MFWNWKVTYFAGGFAPFMDAVDATGAGGGADLSDAGDGSQPSGDAVADENGGEGVAAGDDAGREEALEDLLLDEDDDNQGERSHEERLKAVAKKNRKLKRQLAKLLPLSERLKGVDLDDLVSSKRQFTQLSEQIRNNPRLRALIHGEADEPEQGRRTPAAAEPEEQFDESKLPWDPDASPINRRMTDMAKESFELRQQLKKLQQRLDANDGRETARTEGQVRAEWKNTIETAATQIKSKAVRALFKDNLASLFRDPKVREKFSPKQLVSHYLKDLEADGLITPAEARATAAAAAARPGTPAGSVRTAATQQRIAEQNKQLPRTVATTGTPAPARSSKPNLAALRKQVSAAGR
jgi:hypothetical protein